MISSFVLSSDWTSMRAAILSSSPGICSSWGRQSETLYVQAWSTRNILEEDIINTPLSHSFPHFSVSFFQSLFLLDLSSHTATLPIQHLLIIFLTSSTCIHQYFEYHHMVFEISINKFTLNILNP